MSKVKDENMLSKNEYEKLPLDAYFTPEWCAEELLTAYEFNSPIWEPFVGVGNVAKVLQESGKKVICSDIKNYKYPLTFQLDFTEDNIKEYAEYMIKDFTNFQHSSPRWIITNPPYTHLDWYMDRLHWLCMEWKAGLAVLLRHEWDCAKGRARFFGDNDFYKGKLVLTTRPRWIEKKDKPNTSPRHNYSWFLWDYEREQTPIIKYSYAKVSNLAKKNDLLGERNKDEK